MIMLIMIIMSDYNDTVIRLSIKIKDTELVASRSSWEGQAVGLSHGHAIQDSA